MKKIYKTPVSKVVKFNVQTVLAAESLGFGEDYTSGQGRAKGFYPDFEEEEEMDGYGW